MIFLSLEVVIHIAVRGSPKGCRASYCPFISRKKLLFYNHFRLHLLRNLLHPLIACIEKYTIGAAKIIFIPSLIHIPVSVPLAAAPADMVIAAFFTFR